MQKNFRALSVFLCVTLLFLSVFVPQTLAEATQGRITGDGVRIRKEATTKSEIVDGLSLGTIVSINSKVDGEEVSDGNKIWYNITYENNTGYVYSKYIEEIKPLYDPDFEKNLLNFPESYRDSLRNIHNAYPNWIFIADPVNISLDNAIDLEYSEKAVTLTRKWVELTYGLEWRDPRADENKTEHIRESRWIFASRKAIAFFMDPRNALVISNEKPSFPNIFTFMDHSYDKTTQNESGLRTIIKGTFLENGYGENSDAYITDIMDAAVESGVNPYIIATTIITEQGVNGKSSLISGSYEGYEGYYNFFNFGAAGNDIVKNGLEYAKSSGWNSRRASIIGGANLYKDGYLDCNQVTYYYMDFNVKQPGRIWHQYANNLYDQCIKAVNMKKAYISNHDCALTFKIPVYSSMPSEVCSKPSIDDYNPSDPDTTPDPTPVTDPTPQPEPVPIRRKGDYDGDGNISVVELATIRMYLLGVKSLSSEEKAWLEVSGDNDITVDDLALVRMYLLGLISI